MNFTYASHIEQWLAQLQRLRQVHHCDGPEFFKPYHLATLAHVLRTAGTDKLSLPPAIGDYADTMNLWGALDIPSPFGPKRRQSEGRYHPIQLLRDENLIDDAAEALTALFRSVCNNARTIDGVQTMLRELIGNCFAHAAVQDGLYGIVCAQVWNGGRKAQVASCDSGIGIRASLSQNAALLERLRHANSCELAMEYGVTSKPRRGHSGYGLTVARDLMLQNRGMLYLRSGSEAYRMCRGVCGKTNVSIRWEGTLLVIEWDLDRAVDLTAVYERFPLPEGMSDDDFEPA